MIDKQLEFSLEAQQCRSRDRRRRRQSRAGWWFERMRQVVDGAADFGQGAGSARQTWFGEATETDPAKAKN